MRLSRRNLSRRSFGALIGTGTVAVTVASCTPGPGPSPLDTATAEAPASTVARAAVEELLAAVPRRTITPLVADRLAAGLTPPTNRWFSGLVFGAEPQPVFPSPLGFALSERGFEIWLPGVVVSDKAIIGQRGGGLTLSLGDGAVTALIVGYDVASVTVRLHDEAGEQLVDVRLAQGSPTVSVEALADVALTGPVPHTQAGEAWLARVEDVDFAVVGGSVADTRVELREGETAVWFVAPPGVEVAGLAGKVAPVTGTSFTWELDEDRVTTRIRYEGGPTLVTAMPHHRADGLGLREELGAYAGVYGKLTLHHLQELGWSSPRWPIRAALDLSGLDEDRRTRLRGQAEADVGATAPYPGDSYFGSKALFRDAMLLEVADAVGADEAVATVTARLTEALTAWAEPGGANERASRCFVYDETNRGMVGLEPSFGSEEFNDHHFHYGYLLYAAAVACGRDPELAGRLSPVLDLVAADIASPSDTGFFPQLRPFDVYASHSWASGASPFADGNNQESSSEGVHAWAGLALWARARGDEQLERQATWMHALEAHAATAYWLRPDREPFRGFGHEVIGIGWGAKRDYATWFSPEPLAILMIQVLPASPSAGYLAADPGRIEAAVAEAIGDGDYGRQYGDYVLMYSALAGPEQARQAMGRVSEVAGIIDDGSSLAYQMAFLSSLG